MNEHSAHLSGVERVAALLRKPQVTILLALVMGILVSAVVLAIAGYSPIDSFGAMFSGILSRPRYMVQSVIKATPIILTGISVAFAFKTGLFNIGAEGQYIIGTITAAVLGYFLHLPPVLHFIVVALAAMLFAGVWAGIAGFLKAKFGIHEVIVTIMLNWIALYLNNYLIYLPGFKDPKAESSFKALKTAWIVVLEKFKTGPDVKAFMETHPALADVLVRTDLNFGILVAIIAAIAIWFILNKTTLGFELRAVGLNKDAAEFAGINVKKNIIMSMFIAGAVAGLAGAVQITGVEPHRITILAVSEGYGFDGLTVGLVAGSNPIGCIFSGILFGALKYGGMSIQSQVGAPSQIINIMMGTIVLFIALSNLFVFIADRLVKKKKKGGVQ